MFNIQAAIETYNNGGNGTHAMVGLATRDLYPELRNLFDRKDELEGLINEMVPESDYEELETEAASSEELVNEYKARLAQMITLIETDGYDPEELETLIIDASEF